MPRIGGIDLLRYVRRKQLPEAVILMTAYASVHTAVQALRGEAFDYFEKPFSLPELRQRVFLALQRPSPRQQHHDVMHYGELAIDFGARRVWVEGREAKLTRLEFDLLAYLFYRQGCAVATQELLREVWRTAGSDERSIATVRSCVRRLRNKIEKDAQSPRFITNVWGVGYQLGE